MTADELRKVYDEAFKAAGAFGSGSFGEHDDALLAGARHVAQRQRDSDEWHAEWPKSERCQHTADRGAERGDG